MKQTDFSDLPSISSYRYENFFNVYVDNISKEKFYNVMRSINVFPANNQLIEDDYYTKHHDTWYNISYNYYNTPDLWWLICNYNQILDPSKLPENGTKIKLLKPQYVGYILQELSKQINR